MADQELLEAWDLVSLANKLIESCKLVMTLIAPSGDEEMQPFLVEFHHSLQHYPYDQSSG